MPVKVYDGTDWVTVAGDGAAGAPGAPGTSSSINTWVKTASGGETSVSGTGDTGYGTLAYTVGQELVYLNGVLLDRGDDYTATNGTSIAGLTALTAGDVVTVWTVNSFSVANTYTIAQADAAFTPVAQNYTLINTGGTSLSGSSTVTVSGISGKKDLYIFATGVTGGDVNSYGTITLRFNTDSGSNYEYVASYDMIQNTSTNPFIGLNAQSASATSIALGGDKTPVRIAIRVSGANGTGIKPVSYNCVGIVGNDYMSRMSGQGAYKGTSAITSVSLICSGNFTAGTIFVYGA